MSKTLLGAYIGTPGDPNSPWQSDLSTFASAMGQPPAVVDTYVDGSSGWGGMVNSAQYQAGLLTSNSSLAGMIPDVGIPMATTADSSADAAFQAVAAGQYDSVFDGIFQAYAGVSKTFYIRPGWEMNGNWEPWSVTSANANDFVTAFQHIANLAHSFSGADIKVVWNPAAPGSGTVDFNSIYPGDQYVDDIGIDTYGVGTAGVSDSQVFDTNGGTDCSLTEAAQMAVANNKPLSLDETGDTPADTPTFAANVAQAVDNVPGVTVDHVDIWNDPSGSSNGTLHFATDPNAGASWKQAFANIAAASGSSAGSGPGGGSGRFTPSPNDTVITAGSGSITDANGNVWTVTNAGAVDKNGQAAGYTANVVEAAYVNGNVYHENTSNEWYEWNGSGGWNDVGTISPRPASSGGGSTPSSNNTVIKPGSGSITDTSGNVWTITSSGTVDMNGTPAGYSANVIELAYVNGNVWQENGSNLWWEWQNNSWQSGAGTSQSPLPASSGSSYPAVTTRSGPDSLVLQISENAWANGDKISDANGDAEFTVSINGLPRGGTFTAVAPHATSDGVTITDNPGEQTFTFNGYFGNGAHTVAVTFVNDAYGGSPSTDRNLYVDSVTYNGTNTKQSAPLYGDRTRNFTVTGGTIPSGTGIVTVPTAAAVAQGATAAVAGIQINDPGAATASGNMTLNIKDAADAVILNGQSYAANANVHLIGTEAQLNTDLATLGIVGGKAGSITLDVITQSGVQQEETIPVCTFQSSSAMNFIYNAGSAVTAPTPSSSSPIIYEAESAGTSILTINNFRFGTDSLQLGAGVTITSQGFSTGVIDLNLSNHGQIVVHHS